MAKRRQSAVQAGARALVKRVRALKDKAIGVTWRRLHMVESMLSTIAGYKSALPSSAKLAKRRRRKAAKKG